MAQIEKRIYQYVEKLADFAGFSFMLDKDGETYAKSVTYDTLKTFFGNGKAKVSENDTTEGYLSEKSKFGDEFLVETENPSENENLLTKFKGWIFNSARTFKHILTSTATADRTQTLQDKDGEIALTSDIVNYEPALADLGTMNILTDNVFSLDANKPLLKSRYKGNITEVLIDFDAGTYPNYDDIQGLGCTINVVINGLKLFSTNKLLVDGINTFIPDQNIAVSKNQSIEVEVITGTGSDTVGYTTFNFKIQQYD